MKGAYHLSRHIRISEQGEHTAWFNGLTLKKVYARSEILKRAGEEIQQEHLPNKNRILDDLIKARFFVLPGEDEEILNEVRRDVGGIEISNLRLLVSHRCNFNCRYCQIEQNIENGQENLQMSEDIADRALDLFQKNTSPGIKKTITLTGGEPLLNMPVVKHVISRSRKMNPVRIVIFTNASTITPEVAGYFTKEDILMLVSLDGDRDIHDSARIMIDGRGTFDQSLRGYELLKNAGCQVGISAVAGLHHQNRMDEISDFFIRLRPDSIGLNFGHQLLEKPNPLEMPLGRVADILTEFYKRMRESHIYVENISRFITPFYEETPRLNECQAGGRGITVDAGGRVGPCKTLIVSGRVFRSLSEVNGDISKEAIFRQFAQRTPLTLEDCRNCDQIGICGGGCSYDAFAVNHGEISSVYPQYCDFSRKIVDFLIWDFFNVIKDKIASDIYIPSVEEQRKHFRQFYDPRNRLQQSVGHESNS